MGVVETCSHVAWFKDEMEWRSVLASALPSWFHPCYKKPEGLFTLWRQKCLYFCTTSNGKALVGLLKRDENKTFRMAGIVFQADHHMP